MITKARIPRLAWEILIVLGVAAVATVWLWWSQRQAANEMASLRQQMDTERLEFQSRLESTARSEAEAVARSFGAGVHPSLLARRDESVDVSVGEVVQLPGVVFAHVLESDGGVVASSDRKLALTGQAGARAVWALEAEELEIRTNADGVTEVALPLRGIADTHAVLWIGYDTAALVAASRP